MKEIHISDFKKIEDKKGFIEGLFNDKNFDVCFHYESDFQNTQILREIVDTVAHLSGLSDKWSRRVVLIIDELNNNAIEYGSASGDINKMKFLLTQDEKISLKIEVEDSGKGDKSRNAAYMKDLQSKKLDAGFENHSSIRGRGLFMIIVNLVDNLYFKDSDAGGLIVGIEKTFS